MNIRSTLLAALLAACGCRAAAPPRPFAGAPVEIRLRFSRGTPLGGPIPSTAPAASSTPAPAAGSTPPADAAPPATPAAPTTPAAPAGSAAPAIQAGAGEVSRVSFQLYAIDGLPTRELEDLETQARLIASPRGSRPFQAISLLAGSRAAFLDGSDELTGRIERMELGRSRIVDRRDEALPDGVTLAVQIIDASRSGRATAAPGDAPRRLEAHLHRQEGGAVQIGLAVEAPEVPGRPGEEDADRDDPAALLPPLAWQRELALLDPLPAGEAKSLALFFPWNGGGAAPASLALIIEVRPIAGAPLPADGEDAAQVREMLARCRAGLQEAERQAAASRDPAAPRRSALPGLPEALEGLGSPIHVRNTLVLIAHETRARLAEDAALAADPPFAARLAVLARERLLEAEGPIDRPRAGWIIESAALRLCIESLDENRLDAPIQAILLRRAGLAGKDGTVLGEVLRRSDSLESLQQRLIEENLLALEDGSPAVRLRAEEWLSSIGQAPAGFDALAGIRERKASLQQHLDKQESAAPAAAPPRPGGKP